MTLVVWAACDNFALMMADKRSLSGRIEDAAAGSLALSEKKIRDDVEKVIVSPDGWDAFGASGLAWAIKVATNLSTSGQTGYEVDAALFTKGWNGTDLSQAHRTDALPLMNTIMHAHERDGRMVCSRLDVSPTSIQCSVMSSLSDKIQIAGAGSGVSALQAALSAPRQQARWQVLERQTDDARALIDFLVPLFQVVHLLDDGVGPNVDIWVFRKGGIWERQSQ